MAYFLFVARKNESAVRDGPSCTRPSVSISVSWSRGTHSTFDVSDPSGSATLSAASDEITRDLAPGSVQVRLRGRDPEFVVTLPPAEPTQSAAADISASVAGGTDGDLLTADDGPAARINVRMPEQLKSAIEEAAAKEGRSVNAWLSRAAAAALQGASQRPEPRGGGARGARQFSGWVR